MVLSKNGSLVQATSYSAVVPTTDGTLVLVLTPQSFWRNIGCHYQARHCRQFISVYPCARHCPHFISFKPYSNTIQSVLFFFHLTEVETEALAPNVSASKCLSQSQPFPTSASHYPSRRSDSMDTAALIPRTPLLLGLQATEMFHSSVPAHLYTQEASPHFSPSSLKVKR